MGKVETSRFWSLLWTRYTLAPSVALCRVPELEYAATLDVTGRVLDHCCGDGMFASFAWPDRRVSAGCDVHANSIAAARSLGIYSRLDGCDASKRLPYEDDAFDLVFNNSALEHIKDVDAALFEVSRVLADGGFFFSTCSIIATSNGGHWMKNPGTDTNGCASPFIML